MTGTSTTAGGGVVTVAGTGFGPKGTTALKFLFWDNGVGGTFQSSLASVYAGTVSSENTEITFNAPPGTGTVSFKLSMINTAVPPANAETVDLSFTYDAPIMTALTSAPTQGGVLTITGTSFGPVGTEFISAVTVGTQVCVKTLQP